MKLIQIKNDVFRADDIMQMSPDEDGDPGFYVYLRHHPDPEYIGYDSLPEAKAAFLQAVSDWRDAV